MPQQRRKARFGVGSPLEGCYNTPNRLRNIAGDQVTKAIKPSERTGEKNSFTMNVPTGSELPLPPPLHDKTRKSAPFARGVTLDYPTLHEFMGHQEHDALVCTAKHLRLHVPRRGNFKCQSCAQAKVQTIQQRQTSASSESRPSKQTLYADLMGPNGTIDKTEHCPGRGLQEGAKA